MWVIKKVGVQTSNRGVAYDTFICMTAHALKNYTLIVHLSNTETGDYEVLYSTDWKAFLAKLIEYNPYGFINSNGTEIRMPVRENILVALDDLSLQFLEYVVKVEEVQFTQDDPMSRWATNLRGTFIACDKSRTILECEHVNRCVCTLFHAVCHSLQGWNGDDFYLYSRRTLADPNNFNSLDAVEVVYKITFCDVVRARRLLSKAAVSGINPVSEHINYERY